MAKYEDNLLVGAIGKFADPGTNKYLNNSVNGSFRIDSGIFKPIDRLPRNYRFLFAV